jgi:uncharacterized repeat protein (TIGR01451 family)
VTSAVPGTDTTYIVTVSNNGPSDVTGATLADTFPSAISGATYTAVPSGGATGFTASGNGNISDTLFLPAGSSVTYTVTAPIDPGATGTLSNTATVMAPATATDPIPGNNSDTDNDTLTPTADLGITVSDGTTTAVPGTATTYTIVVSNSGPSKVFGATVNTTLDAAISGANYTRVLAGGATDTVPTGSGDINDTITLPPGSSITYTVHAPIVATATGTLTTGATVTAPGDLTDNNGSNDTASDTDTLTPTVDLSVTVSDQSATATPGFATTYTIVVTNNGPSAVTGATLTDTFPAAITSVSFSSTTSGGATGNTSGMGNIHDTLFLPVGGSVTYTATAQISSSATGTLANTATAGVPGDVIESNPANNSQTDTDTLTPPVDLSVTISDGTTTAVPGGQVTYTITVKNTGPNGTTGASVQDVLPAAIIGASYTSVASGGANGNTQAGSGQILDTVNLPAGGQIIYTVTATIGASASGSLITSASVTAPNANFDTNLGNNSASDTDTLVPSADLTVGQPPPTILGNTLTYTVNVHNNGPSTATGVVLTDTLPAGVTFVSATSATSTPTFSGGVVTANFGTLAPMATVSVAIVVTTSSFGTFTNQASVTATTPDPNSANNSNSLPTTVSPSHIVLTAQPANVGIGTSEKNAVVATFVDTGSPQLPSVYSATINWGDGTAPTTGVVTVSGTTFSVSGSHTYAGPSRYTLTITVVGPGGSPSSVTNTVSIGGQLDRFVFKANQDLAGVRIDPGTLLAEVLQLQGGVSTLALAKQIEGSALARQVLISRLQRALGKPVTGTGSLGALLHKMNPRATRAFVKAVYQDFENRAPTGKELKKALRTLNGKAGSFRNFLAGVVGSPGYLANV